MSAFDIIFFDAGDTLVHPRPSFAGLCVEVASRHGLDIRVDQVIPVVERILGGMSDKQRTGWTFSADPATSREFWMDFYATALKEFGVDGDTEDVAVDLYDTFRNPDNYRAFEDVEPALKALAEEGYTLGIISNFEPWLEELLVSLGLDDFFEHTVISGKVGVEKPHPRIFELALELAGIDPGQAAHVGDSWASDVEGARDAGLTPVLLDRHGRHSGKEVLRVKDLRELSGILKAPGEE